AARCWAAVREEALDAAATARIHATAPPEDGAALAALARGLGFAYVVAGHEVAHEQGLLARAETACVDAYLTPLLRRHVEALAAALGGSSLRLMQSSGGLTEPARLRRPAALLSRP